MTKSIVGVLVIVVLVLGGLAVFKLSSKSPSSTSTPSTTLNQETNADQISTVDVQIKDFSFTPVTVTVKAGTKVTVKNLDVANHTLTSDTGAFDTGLIALNQTVEFTAPEKPGSYPFHCTPHPTMKATLVVE